MPRIDFYGVCNRTPDDINRCYEYNKSLWLPWIGRPQEANMTPLAILGGGPSIKEHIDELRGWPGDIWAINGAFRWCKQNGIKATFFSIDPETYKHVDHPSFEWIERGDSVLVSPRIPEIVVDHCTWVGADIKLFDIHAYVTAATIAFRLAAFLGRGDVKAFGCESCYPEGGLSHAYENCVVRDRIVVECNGDEFLTKPELLEQAKYLSHVIRGIPSVYAERSGGLLRALVQANGDYDVIKIPRWMMEQVVNGASAGRWKQARETIVGWWQRGLGSSRHAGH